MKIRTSLLTSVLISAVLAMPQAMAGQAPEGMEPVKVKRLDSVYKKPHIDWSQYAGIYVEPLDVAGATIKYPRDTKNRDKKPLTEKQIGMMQELYAKAFTRELSEDDFLVAEASGKEGVLILRAKVLEIAPSYVPRSEIENSGLNKVYAENFGKMKIQFQFVDGKTGEVLVQAVDQREPTRMWRELNSVQVRSQMNQLMGSWARIIRTNIEDVAQPQH